MIHYFVGLMLSSGANMESGIAVIDRNNEIILIDKLFSMQDVQHFFDTFPSLNHSQICISLPWDNSMLNGKWRILSKPYQLLSSNENIHNADNWTQRYSDRGSDYFSYLAENGAKISRFELYLTRQALRLDSSFKERSPADCKALQSALKLKYGYNSLLANMMPMAQLEAIVGAILAKNIYESRGAETLFDFNGIPVVRGRERASKF